MSQANPKEAAGRRAAELIQEGMTLGLGTGSTVSYVLQRLAERIRAGHLNGVRGVPTSQATRVQARELGIPLVGLEGVAALDLTIDGADEVDPGFVLVKGGGGALLREKVVASISRREVIVVSPDKLVERLADRFPLPIEVVPFARPVVARALAELGFQPTPRRGKVRGLFRTDNGNSILDARFPGGLDDPAEMERRIAMIPGVVASGLFVGMCQTLVIGRPDGSAELREGPAR